MDRVVRLFHGGRVCDNNEIVGMCEEVTTFVKPPNLNEVLDRARLIKNGVVSLRGRFDAGGGGRAHYVVLKLDNESDWSLYKECLKDAQVKCAEVIVDFVESGDVMNGRGNPPIQPNVEVPIESLTQEGTLNVPKVVEKTQVNDGDTFDLARVTNDFSDDTFEEEEREMEDERNVEQEVLSLADSDGDDEESERCQRDRDSRASSEFVGGGQRNDRESVSFDGEVEIDWSKHYTEEELRALKDMNFVLPKVPNQNDLRRTMFARSDNGLMSNEGPTNSAEPLLRKGMTFDTIEQLKAFFED